MYTVIILILTFCLSANATCPDFKMVMGGDIVPCSGIFLNQKTNDLVKKDLRDNEIRKKQLSLKDLQITELKKDRDNWAKEADKQAKARHEQGNDLRNGFLAGIGITLAIMFGVRQVSK